MRTICIIPARMASSRYPGKPLVPILGMPMILHIWHRCRLYPRFERIIVATCDQEIADVVQAAGGDTMMTAATHPGCVDRTEETVAKLGLALAESDLVLMVQGDEILVNPVMLSDMVDAYRQSDAPVVNLASRIYRTDDHDDPNVVKVVFGPDRIALYMSRAPIPARARAVEVSMYQQTGIIGFSPPFLHRFGRLQRTPLETIEMIDMLRVIENHLPVRIVTTDVETIGIDTKADRDRAELVLAKDATCRDYMSMTAFASSP